MAGDAGLILRDFAAIGLGYFHAAAEKSLGSRRQFPACAIEAVQADFNDWREPSSAALGVT